LGNFTNLKCRECGRKFDAVAVSVCEYCFGSLDVDYNYQRIAKIVTKKRIRRLNPDIWRYHDFLPVEGPEFVNLSAGFTPLQKADRLGAELGIKNLFIKNETVNPTFSVKDRMVAVAVSRAVELGFDTVACASTGNLAHSLAAHAARAGLKSCIFIPHDAEPVKLTSTQIYDPLLVAVKGSTARINSLCNEAMSRMRWGFVNINLRPYYAEGAKTIAYEIVEQLDWSAPDHVIVPVASGTTLTKIHKGFNELVETELLRAQRVALHGVQAEGCAPVVNAYLRGSELIQPVIPATMAKSLSIGDPADGIYAVRIIRETGGRAAAVSDAEIIEGIRLLARTEGIYAEPAGGAAVAALVRFAREKIFRPSDTVVAVVTGLGMKSPEVLQSKLRPPKPISPTIEDLEAFLAEMKRAAFVPGAPQKPGPRK
jgi:threonine synthase